ncbi:hypothetical protein ACROYT_G025764 [Oculina patagonica]
MPTGTMIGRPNISTDHDEPMDEEHRKILKSVREVLVQDMDPEEVLLAMSGSHLLSERDEEKIKAKDLTRHQKCEMLLDTIPKRGAKAYDIFKEAIEKAHSHLISTILKAENSVLRSELSMERENSADLRERLSSTGSQSCPHCSSLNNKLNALRREKESEINRLELNHNTERQTFEKEKNKMEEKIKKLKKGYEQVKKDKNEIEKTKDNLKKENRKSSDLINKLMEEKRKLKEEKKNLEDEKENLTNEKRQIESTVNKKNKENDELLKNAIYNSSVIDRLQDEVNEKQSFCKTLEEQIANCKNFVSRTFLPSDEDFQKPGVICSLKKEKSSEVVATRSSDGPGNANDVVNHQTYKLVKGKTRSCGTAEKQDSWWCVDLGKDYLLFLTHYALRHGKKEGDSILCRRKLQGSIDGKDWKDIKTKNSSNQPMHSGPFPYYTGTWTVGGEVGAFRYFRIVQTGRNSSRKYGIYLYGIELYGVLIKA